MNGLSKLLKTDFPEICTTGYRFSFNGKEKDDEMKGIGNSLDFGARIYDSRLGKFLSIDPCFKEFPFVSPYTYVLNNPLIYIDRDGKKVELAGNLTSSALTQLIETIFNCKVSASFVTNNANKTFLIVHLADGVSINDLSKEEKQVFTLISSMTEATKVYKLKVEESAGGEVDDYDKSEIYPQNFNSSYEGPFDDLYRFDHIVREQKILQDKKSRYEDLHTEDYSYLLDHQKTIVEATEVFGYKMCNVMQSIDSKVTDIDILDKDNRYITTVRLQNNNNGPEVVCNYTRNGVVPGQKIPDNLDSAIPDAKAAIDRSNTHWEENPVEN